MQQERVEHVAVLAFLVFILLGDVWLVKITLPTSVFILVPLLAFGAFRRRLRFPYAGYPLVGMLALIALQISMGRSLNVKSDLAVWTPIIFGLTTVVALSGLVFCAARMARALLIGGVVSGAIMLAMIAFATADLFLVPGQNAPATVEKYKQETGLPASPQILPSDESLVDRGDAFYAAKNRAKNFLGGSNYIAAFFVFLFAVALFSGNKTAALVMALFVCVTLSRLGVVFLCVTVIFYWLCKQGFRASTLALWIAGCAILTFVCVFSAIESIQEIVGIPSVIARFQLLQGAASPITSHPIIGAPRSLIIAEQGSSIIWSPHNSILSTWVSFGLIGFLFYAWYLVIVFRSIAKAASRSQVWSGVLIGLTVLLVWSLAEIIVLTPSFELLIAAMYALSLNVRPDASSRPNFA